MPCPDRNPFRRCRLARVATAALLAAAAAAEEQPDDFKRLSLQQLMEVDVSIVSRREEPLAAVAASVQAVTGDDVRRSGATSLPESLRLAHHLQVAQINARNLAISARGFNSTTSNKLLVMIDGRSVYTPLFAGVFWDVQDVFLPDLDRIEVVNGPGATLWGSNAVNGVINVVTKDARDTQGVVVEAGAGNELQSLAGARYGAAVGDDLHWRVYGKWREVDDSRTPAGADGDDDFHMGQGGARMDWRPAPASHATLQGDGYGGLIDQTTGDDISVSGGNVLARWTQQLADDSDTQLQAYWDRTQRRIPGQFAEDLDTFDVDGQHRFPVGERNDVTWGLGYRVMIDRVANYAPFAFLPDDVTRDLIHGFVQDEIALVQERLHLTLGTKVERNDYTGWEVQPGARLAWRPHEEHTVWASAQRAMRTPSRIDRDFFLPAIGLEGGPDFDSEELWAYEAGWRLRPEERISLMLVAFWHDYDDLRSVEQVSPPAATPVQLGNGFEGESYGIEATAEVQVVERVRLRAGWTELRVSIRHQEGSTDPGEGDTEARDPHHIAKLGVAVDLPRGWEADAHYRYVSEIGSLDLESYNEVDARLGWLPFPKLELSLIGRSLLRDDNAEFGAPATRREIERSVYGRVLWRF